MDLFPDLPLRAITDFRHRHVNRPSKLLFGPDVVAAMAAHLEEQLKYSTPGTPTTQCDTFLGIRFGYMLAPGVAVVK
jgi:hypothetical protein